MTNHVLPRYQAVLVFLAFASAYFLSTLLRAITATLSPVFTMEFSLSAQDLGLLAGGYFLGFSLMQLPMGKLLDSKGPKTVVLSFLGMAVIGCLAFSFASNFTELFVARALIGVGVSACLMAPMTGYRTWMKYDKQQQAGSLMLMVGAMGMLTSTLPVQWLLPISGWRLIFLGLAGLLFVSMLLLYRIVPAWMHHESVATDAHTLQNNTASLGLLASYIPVWENTYFRSLIPMGFFSYGGLIAMQTLWAGPWMISVSGYSSVEAATGLFWINVAMLLTYLGWGLVTPHLYAKGFDANKLIAYFAPLTFLAQIYIVFTGHEAGALAWTMFCITSSVIALSQAAIGMAVEKPLAGRALSAYNLVLFLGVFVVQWSVGFMIDLFKNHGHDVLSAFRFSIGIIFILGFISYLFFVQKNFHQIRQKMNV